jgi:hypothetical protein
MSNPSQFIRVKLSKHPEDTREHDEQPSRGSPGVSFSALATAAGIARLRAAGFEVSLEPSSVVATAALHSEDGRAT